MTTTKICRNYQITIPNSVRSKLNIHIGTQMEVEMQNGQIILTPLKTIPLSEEYFYTEKWQKGEKEANQNIKKGEVSQEYSSADEAIIALKK